MKNFPIPVLEILPVAVMAAALGGCQATTAVEASNTRDPVVAPAGTVLRVRLSQTLETGRSRPGDRFNGVLDSALVSGSVVILPKGTRVEGRVVTATQAGARDGRALLAVKLESYQVGGKWRPIATNTVTKAHEVSKSGGVSGTGAGSGTSGSPGAADVGVTMPADSIIGFTLTGILSS